jgi:nitroreductase
MEILKLIQERRSARGAFDPGQPVAKGDLMQILEAGRWSPTAHNMQNFEIVVVDDKKLLQAIASIRHPVSEVFIRENYEQLSFSEEELQSKKVGILGTMFPPSWRTPGVKPDPAERNTNLGRNIETTPVLLVVAYDPGRRAPASEGDFLGAISLGCVMENMWLMANALGIGCHVVSSLSADEVEQEVKSILGIPGHLRIAFSIRLGYPVPAGKYLRVRREVPDFTHHNRFGSKGIE